MTYNAETFSFFVVQNEFHVEFNESNRQIEYYVFLAAHSRKKITIESNKSSKTNYVLSCFIHGCVVK